MIEPSTDSVCELCGNGAGNIVHIVREMMYGTRETFPYLECKACGSLQLQEVPTDLHRHYRDDYWRFQRIEQDEVGRARKWLRRRRAEYWLTEGRQDLLGRVVALGASQPRYFSWLRRGRVAFSSRILDIGCGIGHYLNRFADFGFTSLTGIDPFIRDEIHYPNGVTVLKRSIFEIDGEFDFIMLHHSLEHMPDQQKVLRRIYELTASPGMVLVRIPIVSLAWRTYGVHWAQIDAPRHLFLHTERSIRRLGMEAGFSVQDVIYDSDPFQFWGSEQYRNDIAMYEPRSYEVDRDRSIFTPQQIDEFRLRASALNKRREGDQACFYFAKPSTCVPGMPPERNQT